MAVQAYNMFSSRFRCHQAVTPLCLRRIAFSSLDNNASSIAVKPVFGSMLLGTAAVLITSLETYGVSTGILGGVLILVSGARAVIVLSGTSIRVWSPISSLGSVIISYLNSRSSL